MAQRPLIDKYGQLWKDTTSAIEIEMWAIRRGGEWLNSKGIPQGLGLFQHYKNLQSLLWPEDDHHRWSDLILEHLLKERIVCVYGCRDSSKTRTISKWALCDFWCFPNETLTLMTSTDTRGLELRVWGDIKELFDRAKDKYPEMVGNVVDAKHGMFTDDLTDNDAVRVMKRGLIGVPCLSSQGDYLGMALKNFAGIKQKRRRLVGDELQYLPVDYLKIIDSLDKGDFKMAGIGNPIAENGKALDKLSEPKNGWASIGEISKTNTWRNKYGGITINLVGIDSPNFDPNTKDQYPYLMNQKDADSVAARPGGKDSLEWWSLVMGVRENNAWRIQ